MYQILIAEESDTTRKTLCAVLQRHFGSRYVLHEAGSGQEALALFACLRPQTAILSVELPDISGLETARRIRGSGSPCMILFLSAFERFADAREAISLQALAYLPKPCGKEELVRAVEESLRLFELREEDVGARALAGEAATCMEEDPGSPRMGQVRESIEQYIRENYRSELSMQDVAKAMNYSDAYFCKLFKRCFQVNFSTYLNEYWVARARELLQTTRLNVREVGVACGYSDANYFARVFKRITGVPPSEYRVY